MSIFRLVVLILFVILSGWGVFSFLRGLLVRSADPENAPAHVRGIGALALAVGIFVVFWYLLAFAEPPAVFMRALRSGDDQKAFELLTGPLQRELGGYEGFADWADGVRPKSWVFFQACSGWDEGRSDGSARLTSGERSDLSFSLERDDGEWRIAGVFFWDLGADYQVGEPSYMDCSD